MSLPITGLYGALLALLFLVLSANVIRYRLTLKVGLGAGEHKPLERAIRVHSNFSEYVPICLLLLGIYELNSGSATFMHVLGAMLFLGRILHAVGLNKFSGASLQRQIGTLLTFTVMLILAVQNIWFFIA